jgi:hypothetical protein
VQLIEVDVIGLKVAQRGLAGTDDVQSAMTVIIRVQTALVVVDFGGDQDMLSPPVFFQCAADDALGFVHVAAVEQVDPFVDGAVENACGLVGGRGGHVVGGIGEVVGPHCQGRNLHPGPTQGPVVHRSLPSFCTRVDRS